MNPEMPDFSTDPIISLLIRFFLNLLVLVIIIRGSFYRLTKNEEYSFSFFIMGIMLFMVCILLQHVQIQMGIALGLFAVFTILRFRTINISLKSATYFFTVIGVSVINAMADFPHPVRGPILINGFIIASVFLLEYFFQSKITGSYLLIYERLELLSPEKKSELYKDITERTRLDVERIEIKEINLLKSVAELHVFYKIKK